MFQKQEIFIIVPSTQIGWELMKSISKRKIIYSKKPKSTYEIQFNIGNHQVCFFDRSTFPEGQLQNSIFITFFSSKNLNNKQVPNKNELQIFEDKRILIISNYDIKKIQQDPSFIIKGILKIIDSQNLQKNYKLWRRDWKDEDEPESSQLESLVSQSFHNAPIQEDQQENQYRRKIRRILKQQQIQQQNPPCYCLVWFRRLMK